MSTTALGRPTALSLDAFAAMSKLHPEHVRRLVALGVLDATPSSSGDLIFKPDQLVVLARVQRLRAGFGLDYVAAGLVCHLLGRIDALEHQLRFTEIRTN